MKKNPNSLSDNYRVMLKTLKCFVYMQMSSFVIENRNYFFLVNNNPNAQTVTNSDIQEETKKKKKKKMHKRRASTSSRRRTFRNEKKIKEKEEEEGFHSVFSIMIIGSIHKTYHMHLINI